MKAETQSAIGVGSERKELSEVLGDLRECNKEQIQYFTSIQGRGCLIAFTWPDQRVQSASQNIGDMIDMPHSQILGARLEHFLGREFIEKVERTIPEISEGRARYLFYEVGVKTFEAYLYRTEGLYLLEFEPATPKDEQGSGSSELDDDQNVRDFMLQAKDATTLSDLSKVTARAIRSVTGIDRVMIYRFLKPSYHGEVIAEDRVAKAHSFNGHRFPASDIPLPARELYLRNSVRMIPDINQPETPLSPPKNPLTRKPIDLSDSRLRAVSKIHLEYLRNMGVSASYSFGIVNNGQLWGLVACHHLEPLRIARSRIVSCEIIASAFAARAEMLETLAYANGRLAFDRRLMRFFDQLRNVPDPVDELFRQHRHIETLFRASGLAYVSGGRVDFAGLTPTSEDIEKLAQMFLTRFRDENKTELTMNLADIPSELFERIRMMACSILAVSVPGAVGGVLMFLRPEVVRTITWSGDPRKNLEKKEFQGRINPRESFHAWEETVRDQAVAWEPFEVDGAIFLRDLIFDVLAKRQSLINELSEQLREARARR